MKNTDSLNEHVLYPTGARTRLLILILLCALPCAAQTFPPSGGGGVAGTFNARGTYAGGTTYAALDLVSYSGVAYVSVAAGNVGHQPDTSPTFWATPDAAAIAWAAITSKPATFAPSAHAATHGNSQSDAIVVDTSQITTGSFALARIPTGTLVTQVALGNHTHAGVYEPIDATILRQASLAGSGSATTPAKSDHTHSGVYQPALSSYATIVSLWTSCTGFLKNDGTCSSGTVSAHGSSHGNGQSDPVSLDATQTATGIFAIGRIPTGTTSSTVSLGNHAHSGVYQPVLSSFSTIVGLWTTCTSGYLKYDGSCATPAGASGSSAGGANAVQVSDGAGAFVDGGCTMTGGVETCIPAGGKAGMHALPQGTANTAPANSVGFQAPTSVPSAYFITLPTAPAAGFVKRTNATPSVESVAAIADGDLPSTMTGKTVDGASPTEIGYLSGVTSAIQTQFGGKVATTVTVNGRALSGNITLVPGDIAGVALTVASGTSALGTSAIASGACATVVTTTATGTASTDSITFTPNGSIKAVTGYVPSTAGGLTVTPYPTTNNVNFDVCNWGTASITPGAVTLNWRVAR